MHPVAQATQIRGEDEEEDQEGAASTSGRENVEPHTFLQLLGTAQVSLPTPLFRGSVQHVSCHALRTIC